MLFRLVISVSLFYGVHSVTSLWRNGLSDDGTASSAVINNEASAAAIDDAAPPAAIDNALPSGATDEAPLSADVKSNNAPETSSIAKNTVAEQRLEASDGDKKPERNIYKCWMSPSAKQHFIYMEQIDKDYASVRKLYKDAVDTEKFDKDMVDVMVKNRGAAQRAVHNYHGDAGMIPAGLQLGGYGMMDLDNSIMFFSRMKLRNNTHFHINSLHNDLYNMTITTDLNLNDLHILGSYERVIKDDDDQSKLHYTPNYGNAEFLLKNAKYRMQGRYRLLKDRLTIEHTIAALNAEDLIMTYQNINDTTPVTLSTKQIDGFLNKIKHDLNEWLKDYFNDYLMYFGLVGASAHKKFLQYDKLKTMALNNYVDNVAERIRTRLYKKGLTSVKLPNFSFFAANGVVCTFVAGNSLFKQQVILSGGALRGLESIYRRSVATGIQDRSIRRVDAVVGFSKLKVMYKYTAVVGENSPLLPGFMTLSANDLTAHLAMMLVKNPEVEDLTLDVLSQTKPESLTVEGAGSRFISNYKHILEYYIISLMTNTMAHTLKLIQSITRCESRLLPSELPHKSAEESTENDETETTLNPYGDPGTYIDESQETDTNKEKLTKEPGTQNEEATQQSEDGTPDPGTQNEDETPQSEDNTEDRGTATEEPGPSYNTLTQDEDPNKQTDKKDDSSPDYIVTKNDSIELELPETKNAKKKTMHLKYKEKFTLTKLN